jgi:hypothetical protein
MYKYIYIHRYKYIHIVFLYFNTAKIIRSNIGVINVNTEAPKSIATDKMSTLGGNKKGMK